MKYLFAFVLVSLMAVPVFAEVPYITGGIGSEERERSEAEATNYNFEVKAAYTTGHYLADVMVSVTNADGIELLSAITEGPYFFAKLEAGSYVVTASFEGQTQVQKISIAADTKMRQAIFRFNPVGDPEE